MRNDKITKPKGLATYQNVDSSSYLRLQRNQEIRENLQNISQLLNTGLSAETLDICVKLCEAGVHPQSLADVSIFHYKNLIERQMIYVFRFVIFVKLIDLNH